MSQKSSSNHNIGQEELQERLNSLQESPKRSQESPKSLQESPKRVQDLKNDLKIRCPRDPKIEKKSVQIALGWLWVAQGVPGSPQTVKILPKWSPRPSKMRLQTMNIYENSISKAKQIEL